MKNLARLLIFFSLTFVIVFILAAFFRFLSSWIDSVRVIYQDPEQGGVLLASAGNAVAGTLFITILLSLSYSVRKKIPAIVSIAIVFLLSIVFCLGFYIGIERVRVYDPSLEIPDRLSRRSGLILSRLDTDIIQLKEENSAGIAGFPRVISFPERQLLYQEAPLGPGNVAVELPLEEKTPWFIQSILIDFTLASREFNARRGEGLFSFLAFTGSLFLLLVSLRFLLGLSSWPLANLFLGAMAFRFVLSLLVFLRSAEVISFLVSFVNKRLPDFLLVPAVFGILGIFIILYTFLAFFAGRMRRDDE